MPLQIVHKGRARDSNSPPDDNDRKAERAWITMSLLAQKLRVAVKKSGGFVWQKEKLFATMGHSMTSLYRVLGAWPRPTIRIACVKKVDQQTGRDVSEFQDRKIKFEEVKNDYKRSGDGKPI